MAGQLYLTDTDIEIFEMLTTLFWADAGNTGDYSKEEESGVDRLEDKISRIKKR